MTYTPINWQTGDTITAEKMNKMDNGWSVTSGTTTLCDETVTTEDDSGDNVAYLSISDQITAETLDVTFAGTKYTCTRNVDAYGDSDGAFATYPFRLYDDGSLYTESAGTYAVKIEVVESSVDTSAAFAAAVADVLPLLLIVEQRTTWQEVSDALSGGAIVLWVMVEPNGCTVYFTTSAYEGSGYYYVTIATVYQTNSQITIRRLVAPRADGALEPAL